MGGKTLEKRQVAQDDVLFSLFPAITARKRFFPWMTIRLTTKHLSAGVGLMTSQTSKAPVKIVTRKKGI